MTTVALLIAITALIIGLAALSRGKEASERVDDSMRYISDLRTRHGGEIKELFREVNKTKARLKKMRGEMDEPPYEISDACVACGTCETECPEDAVKPGDIYRIDPELCTSCGICASVCPVDACEPMKID